MKLAPLRVPSVDQISADCMLTAASPFRDSLLFVTHGVGFSVHETDGIPANVIVPTRQHTSTFYCTNDQ